MSSDYLKMLKEVESLEHTIEHVKGGGTDLIRNMLVYIHGDDHPLSVAIREESHGAGDEEALSELLEVMIGYAEARKKFVEAEIKYTERGLKLMKDQPALDDDDPDFIKLWKSRE